MNKSIKLTDDDYSENNIMIELTKGERNNVCTLYNVYVTYDNSSITKEVAFFKEDLDFLQSIKIGNKIEILNMIEPDLSFTIIPLTNDWVVMYINFDSGVAFSNIATDSGMAVRMNTYISDLTAFLKVITL